MRRTMNKSSIHRSKRHSWKQSNGKTMRPRAILSSTTTCLGTLFRWLTSALLLATLLIIATDLVDRIIKSSKGGGGSNEMSRYYKDFLKSKTESVTQKALENSINCSCPVRKESVSTKPPETALELPRLISMLLSMGLGQQNPFSAVDKALADSRLQLTYDDPEKWVKSEKPLSSIEGWPPIRDRNISTYVRPGHNTVLSDVTCLDLKKVRLLVLVKAAVEDFAQRRATRGTYGQYTKNFPQVKVLHLLGTRPDMPKLQQEINNEHGKHCDIIQFDFVDHYNNLTLKTVSAMKFILSSSLFSDNNPEVVLLLDSDSYVNIPLLWKGIFEEKRFTGQTFQLWGFKGTGYPIRYPNDTKGFLPSVSCPKYLFNGDYFPMYLSGAGYLLPRATLPCLFIEALKLPYLHIEDVFTCGFVAERCGFPRHHFTGFYCGTYQIKDMKPADVLIHYQNPSRKRAIHHIFTRQDGIVKDCSNSNNSSSSSSDNSFTYSTRSDVSSLDMSTPADETSSSSIQTSTMTTTPPLLFVPPNPTGHFCMRGSVLHYCDRDTGMCGVDPNIVG